MYLLLLVILKCMPMCDISLQVRVEPRPGVGRGEADVAVPGHTVRGGRAHQEAPGPAPGSLRLEAPGRRATQNRGHRGGKLALIYDLCFCTMIYCVDLCFVPCCSVWLCIRVPTCWLLCLCLSLITYFADRLNKSHMLYIVFFPNSSKLLNIGIINSKLFQIDYMYLQSLRGIAEIHKNGINETNFHEVEFLYKLFISSAKSQVRVIWPSWSPCYFILYPPLKDFIIAYAKFR